jgi:AcrR family transcriptional regulator
MFTLSTPSEERSYHHGDLRRALIRSALEILSETGVAGLSLRAAARAAKVSAMAPYRHFADKEALLAAVAEYGFQQLGVRFATTTTTVTDPRAQLAALGVAYVVFARDEPSLFKLMFGPTIEKKSAHPGLEEAGWACFNALRQAVAMAGFFDDEHALNDVSLACCSLVHGLSALIVDGRLVDEGAGPPEAIATRLTRLLVGALAALADVKRPAAGSNTKKPAPDNGRRPARVEKGNGDDR